MPRPDVQDGKARHIMDNSFKADLARSGTRANKP
jgi:hypothetical protein